MTAVPLPSVALLLSCLLVACGSDPDSQGSDGGSNEADPEDSKVIGTPSGATCGSAGLTYENFGKPFFDGYCISCHASGLTGDARRLAPVGHDFDTLAGIRKWPNHIDQKTASGPSATNTSMPSIPNIQGMFPSEDERKKLGEWLACGAP